MANLKTEIAGIELRNPLLSGSGPISRDGYSLKEVANHGAGGLVAKTVSTEPAEAPRPNLAKIGESLINAELWSEVPLKQWLNEEYPKAKETDLPLIASIGYTPEEIEEVAPKVAEAGADAIELSTKNSDNDPSTIEDMVKVAKENVDIPVFIKLNFMSSGIVNLAEVAEEAGADGIVAIEPLGPSLAIEINTEKPLMGSERGYGWLSGPSIKPLALRCVADISSAVEIPVIGAGGIKSADDVIEFLMAGASAVEITTAAITRGDKIFGLIADNLSKFLNGRGYDSIEDLKGSALKNLPDEPIRTTAKQPDILTSKCTGCGLCAEQCPFDAVTIVSGKARIDSARCTGCGLCVSVCPPTALRF